MPTIKIVIPKMGESIMEASIIKWLKKEGDSVYAEESLAHIATDKIDSEIVAQFSGTLKKILIQEGAVAAIGDVIATLDTEEKVEDHFLFEKGIKIKENSILHACNVQENKNIVNNNSIFRNTSIEENNGNTEANSRFYSPLIRRIANAANLSLEELDSIPATAKNNRISKYDIDLFLKHRPASTSCNAHEDANPLQNESISLLKKSNFSTTIDPEDIVIELDRVRQIIGQRMVEAKRTIPHVTSFIEADVSEIVNWRNLNRKKFEEAYGLKLTFMPLFLRAIVLALQEMRNINAHFINNKLILKKQINIGMAVALPNGNLIVPVIKSVDKLNLVETTQYIIDLANRARLQQLEPSDVMEATYTVSNIGSFGNSMGTPIISAPQVAVMALGAVIKKPAVITTKNGDEIGIRNMMFLSHSYDHRVIDGALGGGFAQKVSFYLENFKTWIDDYNGTFEK